MTDRILLFDGAIIIDPETTTTTTTVTDADVTTTTTTTVTDADTTTTTTVTEADTTTTTTTTVTDADTTTTTTTTATSTTTEVTTTTSTATIPVPDGSIIWQVGTATATPGSQATLQIIVRDPNLAKLAVSGANFIIDTNGQLKVVDSELGNAYSGAGLVPNGNEIAFATSDGKPVVAADGSVLLTFTVDIPEDIIPDGESSVTIPVTISGLRASQIIDPNEIDVTKNILVMPGSITVERPVTTTTTITTTSTTETTTTTTDKTPDDETTTTTTSTTTTTTTTTTGEPVPGKVYARGTTIDGYYFSHDHRAFSLGHIGFGELVDLTDYLTPDKETGVVSLVDSNGDPKISQAEPLTLVTIDADGNATETELDPSLITFASANNGSNNPAGTFDEAAHQFSYQINVLYNGEQLLYEDGTPVSFTAYIGVKGDVDLDLVVDSADSSAILEYYAQTSTGKLREEITLCPNTALLAQDPEFENLSAFLADVDTDEYSPVNFATKKTGRVIDSTDSSGILYVYAETQTAIVDNKEERDALRAKSWNALYPGRIAADIGL
jgi:hypothetical protein